jgi:predicted ATPase/DNA-binding XRE family transcriptional regulator
MDINQSFGQWVQQRRKALDLTQAVLAQRIGCSVSAIKKIETDQRRPSQQLVERLADALSLPLSDRALFLQLGRTAADAAPPSLAPSNLPTPQTSFIGREQETALLRALLRDDVVHLLTLTGPGGVGKTRLAIQVAADLRSAFPHGVWFVALADLRDPSDIVITVARALGVKPSGNESLRDQLQAHLSRKQALLILDNFEHLVAATPLLSALVAAAPQLKLLVTSRTVLNLTEEHEVIVAPLPVPHSTRHPSVPVLAQYPAIALFTARAQRVASDFALTRDNVSTIATICAHLDGLPLAIELAAARSRFFTPALLLDRLSSRLGLLAGGAANVHPRQQTLQATLAWSYTLLKTSEQALFARLAAFVGGCTVEAVEAICGPVASTSTTILDDLTVLLDHSLLGRERGQGGAPRLVMLETIREYAQGQLAARDEIASMQQRHAAYYLALAETVEPTLRGTGQAEALDRLEADYPNIRAALHWSIDQADAMFAARLSVALIDFWDTRGYVHEGRSWLSQTLALAGPIPAALQAKLLKGAGWLAWTQGDYSQAEGYCQASLALFEQLGDVNGRATILNQLGLVAWRQTNYRLANDRLTESLNLCRGLEDHQRCARALNNLALIAEAQGDKEQALELYAESVAILRQYGDNRSVAGVLGNMGILAMHQDDKRAAEWFTESLALRRALEDKVGIARMLQGLGVVALHQGRLGEAYALTSESLQLMRDLNSPVGVAYALGNLGEMLVKGGDMARAATLYAESLLMFQVLGNQRAISELLESHAELAAEQQDWERALQLYGSAAALRARIGAPQPPYEYARHARQVAAARSQLSAASASAAWEAGEATTTEAAIAYALHPPAPKLRPEVYDSRCEPANDRAVVLRPAEYSD